MSDTHQGAGDLFDQYEQANLTALFYPRTGGGELPAVQVAGVMAFLYVDRKARAVRVSVDLSTAESWLPRIDGKIPLIVEIGDNVIFDDSNAVPGRQPGHDHRPPPKEEQAVTGGYSIAMMAEAYADLLGSLRSAGLAAYMYHTGGGAFVILVDLHEGRWRLAIGATDGPLHYPDESRGHLELLLFREARFCEEWPSVHREPTHVAVDPAHRELVAIACATAEKVNADSDFRLDHYDRDDED